VTSATETYLELSSSHPPVHHATYPLEIDPENPSNIKVKVDVIYRKRRILPYSKFRCSVFLRFLEDVGTKHFVLTLEATISKENGNHFQFPTENKHGCRLEMDLKFQGREIGHRAPQQKKVGDTGKATLVSHQKIQKGSNGMDATIISTTVVIYLYYSKQLLYLLAKLTQVFPLFEEPIP